MTRILQNRTRHRKYIKRTPDAESIASVIGVLFVSF